MAKHLLKAGIALLILWGAITLLGALLLPAHLLKAPLPVRTDAQRASLRAALTGDGDQWTFHRVRGGEGFPLEVAWLHRPRSKGVAMYLHGFGDDAFGTVGYSPSLPDWDAVMFTFRGRDRHPEIASTLGAWERIDVTAVVAFLEGVAEIARFHPDLVVVAGAGHCQAGARLPQGWSAWAQERLERWGLLD